MKKTKCDLDTKYKKIYKTQVKKQNMILIQNRKGAGRFPQGVCVLCPHRGRGACSARHHNLHMCLKIIIVVIVFSFKFHSA